MRRGPEVSVSERMNGEMKDSVVGERLSFLGSTRSLALLSERHGRPSEREQPSRPPLARPESLPASAVARRRIAHAKCHSI